MVRDQDFRDGSAKHHLADGGGASVGLCLVHASTNVRFEREKLCPQQQLIVTGLGNRTSLKSKIAFLRLTDRTSCQDPFACAPVAHLIVSPVPILPYGIDAASRCTKVNSRSAISAKRSRRRR